MTNERTANFTGLDQVDIELIQKQGAPVNLRQDLVAMAPDGQVELTIKGRRFYEAAASYWQVELPTFLNVETLLAFHCELGFAVLDAVNKRLETALIAGELEPKCRPVASAMLYGDPEHYKTLMKQAA